MRSSWANKLGDEVVVVAARSIEVQMMFFGGAFEAAAQLADDLVPRMRRLADRWSEANRCQGACWPRTSTALGRGDYAQARRLPRTAGDQRGSELPHSPPRPHLRGLREGRGSGRPVVARRDVTYPGPTEMLGGKS